MRKRVIAVIATLILASFFMQSCLFASGMSREECLKDYKETYKHKLIDHFNENEEIFRKVAASISDYLAGAGSNTIYRTFSLGNHGAQSINGETVKFTLFTVKQLSPDDNEDIAREYTDFLNDRSFNIYGLTAEELAVIFTDDAYDFNSGAIRYTKALCEPSADEESRESAIRFSFALDKMYNKADRIGATLVFSVSGDPAANSDRINDQWHIEYSVYWSPAI
ncbi:MAG: hypothetical protein FWG48_04595 [Oscillospiraceae bacterium]|nr:hypothetical protein [Oscillospiraceae bacterium]